MADSAGLQRVAMDLHVHSPASHDWRGGNITAQQFVDHVRSLGLAAIAVTDHQSGDWIDDLKAAARGTDLVVFPGVEINNLAGNEGIHLHAIFDVDMTTADIDRFLAEIGVLKGIGDNIKRGSATKGPLDVLNIIRNYGGIAVLAHCKSAKGALGHMRGDLRTTIIQHPTLLAAEAPAEDFYDDAKRAARKRVYDLLDGTDVTYQKKCAVYQASDNPSSAGTGHDLTGIGQRFSYFNVEFPLRLESLRQCFIDREVRIDIPPVGTTAANLAPSKPEYPYIGRVQVTGGFLDGLDLALHPGLTTILGAKGSGKSLLVELLRFALNQEPSQPDILSDHNVKLKSRLGLYGRVSVTLFDEAGQPHIVTREYDPSHQNPFHDAPFDPADFFPCHFLSQNEIVRLAESKEEQIRFIDSFFDFRAHLREIERLRSKVADTDKTIADQVRARKALVDLRQQHANLTAQIAEKDKQLSSPIFSQYRDSQAKLAAVQSDVQTILPDFAQTVTDARTAIEALGIPPLPENLGEDPLVRRVRGVVEETKARIIEGLVGLVDVVAQAVRGATGDLEAWRPEHERLSDEYSKHVQSSGGGVPALNQERSQLVIRRNRLEADIAKEQQQSQLLNATVQLRTGIMSQLEAARQAYTEERQSRCTWFTERSNQRVRAEVEPGADYSAFSDRLTQLKRGSYLSGAEIEAIAGSVTPSGFVRAILRFDLSRNAADLQPLVTQTEIPADRLLQLVQFLLTEVNYTDLLALEHSFTPKDRPRISLRVDDETYRPLEELSTGQKSTVLLVMALCEGNKPVIVDQPEDSLDIRTIWEDMCLRVRTSKRGRQFFFTTHNSSLAVASDTDKFAVFEADARKGQVSVSGAIDSQAVRQHVIQLLEGGRPTYFLKQSKYNIRDDGLG